jgi:hypothetical protein
VADRCDAVSFMLQETHKTQTGMLSCKANSVSKLPALCREGAAGGGPVVGRPLIRMALPVVPYPVRYIFVDAPELLVRLHAAEARLCGCKKAAQAGVSQALSSRSSWGPPKRTVGQAIPKTCCSLLYTRK